MYSTDYYLKIIAFSNVTRKLIHHISPARIYAVKIIILYDKNF